MSDIKKLVSDKLGEVKAKSSVSSYSSGNWGSCAEKARKILTFAEPILREFTQQTNKKFRRVSGRSGYGDCEAQYEIFIPNWLGLYKKSESYTLEVIIGVTHYGKYVTSGITLVVGSHQCGNDVDIKNINEKWFIGILAEEYQRKNWY